MNDIVISMSILKLNLEFFDKKHDLVYLCIIRASLGTMYVLVRFVPTRAGAHGGWLSCSWLD